MAHFRGTVQGGRGEAHRLGTKTQGLITTANSWKSTVTVRYTWDNDKQDTWVTIVVSIDGNMKTIFDGSETDLSKTNFGTQLMA